MVFLEGELVVLGIETSCDETACGIVTDRGVGVDASARGKGAAADACAGADVGADAGGAGRIMANVIATQFDAHRPYGGVVPEVAARAHLDRIDAVVKEALATAQVTLNEVDAIAATCGPGLIGGVMVGAMMGKALAAVAGKPFLAINHLEAHALTARLSHDVAFPYLLLLVSGGHCQIVLAEGVGRYTRLGGTRDDAVGECFDKCAKMLGLGYPGGPLLEKAAAGGNPKAFDLPRPMIGRAGCDFSFSGLKTAVRLAVEAQPQPLPAAFVADMAASLQAAIADILVDRVRGAFAMLEAQNTRVSALVVGGGVAANERVRAALTQAAEAAGVPFLAPPISLCTDNGVMIAWAGLERLRLGQTDGLDVRCRPRWPLEELNKDTT